MVTKKSKKTKHRKQCQNARKRTQRRKKLQKQCKRRTTQISANTPYDMCTERMTPFGGLLALVKFLDLIKYEQVFNDLYVSPSRKAELGCYRMVLGLLMMLFIGFHRISHMHHLRRDPVVSGILKVTELPVVSTFWRYVQSLKIMQSQALIRIMGSLRARIWTLIGYQPKEVRVNIDTTVATVYGNIQSAYKGHNTKHRGKKGLRPVLCFTDETREYLCGNQRRGKTITGKEVAYQIKQFRKLLPSCVTKVLVCGDGEFISAESVSACVEEGFSFILGNRRCSPAFSDDGWYRHGLYEYNECLYQPTGWDQAYRFVVMRIHKEDKENRQLNLFKGEDYLYRIFVTNLKGKPHTVIAKYDKRADVENSIGEAQREGILAIPSKKFQSNHAFFQIVMLAYNLWRWLKLCAGHHYRDQVVATTGEEPDRIEVVSQTIRLARLKMLYVAAKVSHHSNRDTMYYSIHDTRASGIIDFLEYLDVRRREKIPWPPPRAASYYAKTG